LELPTNPRRLDVEFDLDALLRMDSKTQIENAVKGISGGLFTPNEQRAKLGLKPVEGGDQVYAQQQNFSLEALARRDAEGPAPDSTTAVKPEDDDVTEAKILVALNKHMRVQAASNA
jgi:phage portal protein BeeE